MNEVPHIPVLITPEAAAERLSISRTRIYELISAGIIESVKIGRLRRLRPQDLEAFVARLSEEASRAA
jgi:excisionase family DNA binding protein